MLSRRLVILIVSVLAAIIILLSGVINAYTRHGTAQQNWSEQLSRSTLLLSQHVSQSMFAGESVVAGLLGFSNSGLLSEESAYTNRILGADFKKVLNIDSFQNPIVSGAAFFSKTGVLLRGSSTHDWSSQQNVITTFLNQQNTLQRDRAYISDPVKNIKSDSWYFYMIRRVESAQGEMLGFVMAAISVKTFTDFYQNVGYNLGEGASVSLYRDDFMLMARWPSVDNMLGRINVSSATHEIINIKKLTSAVIITDSPRMTVGDVSQLRMTASRVVDHFPFILTLVVTRDLYLKEWDRVVMGIFLRTVLALTLLIIGTSWLLRSDERVRKELMERKAAQDMLRAAHEQLEMRVEERTAELTTEVAERMRIEKELIAANALTASVSHQAGMAEVANSVLHNVGNVLNSVNVSVTLINEQLHSTSLKNFPKAADLLSSHQSTLASYLTEDAQGKKIPLFLELLARQWESEHQMMLSETKQLVSSIQHIKEIISRQQTISGQGGLTESVNLKSALRDALILHAVRLSENMIEVREDGDPELIWVGDRIKLMQILLNLIINAQEAMALNVGPRLMHIRTWAIDANHINIAVSDNGIGMSEETLKNIFNYGFTTKKDGHGFGLHASAVAAQQMGGKLDVFSQGTGFGTTFTLSLVSQLAVATSSSESSI